MKHFRLLSILIAASLMLGCSENAPFLPDDEPGIQSLSESGSALKGAAKPLATLIGTSMEELSSPYPWMGNIDFSQYDGYDIYKIAYDNMELFPVGNSTTLLFRETFYIYLGDDPVHDYLLKGMNEGVMVRGSRFYTHGMVEEVDEEGPFNGWEGRRVHVHGVITEYNEDGPSALESTYRLN